MTWADQNCAKCTDDDSGINCNDCILKAFQGDKQEFETCCPCIWRAAKMFRLVRSTELPPPVTDGLASTPLSHDRWPKPHPDPAPPLTGVPWGTVIVFCAAPLPD